MIYSDVKSLFKMEEDIHFINKNNSLMHNLLNHYLGIFWDYSTTI